MKKTNYLSIIVAVLVICTLFIPSNVNAVYSNHKRHYQNKNNQLQKFCRCCYVVCIHHRNLLL